MILFYPAFRLAASIVLIMFIGGLIGSSTNDWKDGWYKTLTLSSLTPLGWVFGQVWTVLYIMIGFALWRIWERYNHYKNIKLVGGLFAAQMLLNWAWPIVFFAFHQLLASFVIILLLVPVLVALVFVLWREDKTAAIALMPYTAWCGFATYLSGAAYFLNNG